VKLKVKKLLSIFYQQVFSVDDSRLDITNKELSYRKQIVRQRSCRNCKNFSLV